MEFLVWCLVIGAVIGLAVAAINSLCSAQEIVVDQDDPAMQVAQAIAYEFLHGEIHHYDLPAWGISEIQIYWEGVLVSLSWYTRERFRSLYIGDKGSSLNDACTDVIFKAGLNRAESLIQEDLARLSHKLMEKEQ